MARLRERGGVADCDLKLAGRWCCSSCGLTAGEADLWVKLDEEDLLVDAETLLGRVDGWSFGAGEGAL